MKWIHTAAERLEVWILWNLDVNGCKPKQGEVVTFSLGTSMQHGSI